MVKPTSIVDVQVLLGDTKLANLFDWDREGKVIIAKPKRRLSNAQFQEVLKKFQKIGGRYAGYIGFTIEV